jgi:hypothetical protein
MIPDGMSSHDFYRALQALERRYKIAQLAEEMELLALIDDTVADMDSYPEADHLIWKIQRRNLNDKDF